MIFLKKNIAIVLTIVLLSVIASAYLNSVSLNVFKNTQTSILIDAGHGYPDGGAVASDGTVESEINLAIADKLYKILNNSGVRCSMIRSGNEGIYTEGSSIHEKKVSDIRNRVKIAKSNPQSLIISIHMNTYPDPNVHGTQVFYKADSELSRVLAEELQNVINTKFQSDNCKKTKVIPTNIYFFKNIQNDCVLVECGFLTNSNDLNKLKNDEFQTDLATQIAEIILFKITGSELNGN